MRFKDAERRGGFTMTEVSIATAILLLAIGLAMAGLAYFLRAAGQSDVQNELDIDVQKSIERLKYDLRLSSLDEMFFYPAGAGPYSAVSFPLARDTDGDGAVDLDGDGRIIWDRTLVYHVWSGSPNQLRLTVFDPRDETLDDAERQQQINHVATVGSGTLTHNGGNSSTTVVFENLFQWSIRPRGSVYDGYAPVLTREANVGLGSMVLTPGAHTFKFEVTGRNADSSGYRIGVDSLVVSPCSGVREAEAQLPVVDQSGATAVMQYMSMGSWSGNHHLYFPATEVGHYFSLSLENDRWEETNFARTGARFFDTAAVFDQSGSPYDFVAQLDGFGWNWFATDQTGDAAGSAPYDNVRGCAVRVVMRGSDMADGGWIQYNGGRCWVNFRSGNLFASKLRIEAATIAECASQESPSMDTLAGTTCELRFLGAKTVTINGGTSQWSDQANYAIDRDKSYVVSFLVDHAASMGNAWHWTDSTNVSVRSTYIIPASSVPGEADLLSDVWSTRTDVVETNAVLGVQYLYSTYPTNGFYESAVIDTRLAAPVYSDIDWHESVPVGTDIRMKVRSGSSNDLSDAAAWTNIASMASPGSISPGNGRYVQFQCELTPNTYGTVTPKVKDVTLRWGGAEQFVDIVGTFTKGPEYGIFELTIDGQPLKMGVNVELEIFKDVRGFRGTRRVRSAVSAEITPRNTGR